MTDFLTSNEWEWRLLRMVIQGVLGVVVANIDLLVGVAVLEPTWRAGQSTGSSATATPAETRSATATRPSRRASTRCWGAAGRLQQAAASISSPSPGPSSTATTATARSGASDSARTTTPSSGASMRSCREQAQVPGGARLVAGCAGRRASLPVPSAALPAGASVLEARRPGGREIKGGPAVTCRRHFLVCAFSRATVT